jgi:hypothetical protein
VTLGCGAAPLDSLPLMLGEALVRGLIRLLVTVGILAAVYLFLVKPVLDTTNNTIRQTFEGGAGIGKQIEDLLDSAGVQDTSIDLGSGRQAQRLLRCIQRAGDDATRIERCTRRFG